LGQLPVQYEPCRASFVAGAKLFWRTKPLDELAYRFFPVGNRAKAAYAFRLGYRYSYRFGADIQAQKS
jgi:hypothetical protein